MALFSVIFNTLANCAKIVGVISSIFGRSRGVEPEAEEYDAAGIGEPPFGYAVDEQEDGDGYGVADGETTRRAIRRTRRSPQPPSATAA